MTRKQRSTPQPPRPATPRSLPAGLVAVACRRCNCHLVDVIAGASVWCAACQVWTLARPAATTATTPAQIHLPNTS